MILVCAWLLHFICVGLLHIKNQIKLQTNYPHLGYIKHQLLSPPCSPSHRHLHNVLYGVRWKKNQQENNKPNSIPSALFSLLPQPPPSARLASPFPSVLGELEELVHLTLLDKQTVGHSPNYRCFCYSNVFFLLEEDAVLSRLALSRRCSVYDTVPV